MKLINQRSAAAVGRACLFASLMVPTTGSQYWQIEKYSNIPANKVTFSDRGLPKFENVQFQGGAGADDYALRVGFVIPGEKHLSGIRKLLAPTWVRHLYSKVPEGLGIDHVEFFNVAQNARQVGQFRVHPKSDLIHETFFANVEHPGPFDFTYTFKEPIHAAALWISVDGDDTKSTFEVAITKIEVFTDKGSVSGGKKNIQGDGRPSKVFRAGDI